MKVTPLDLRQAKLTVGFRGYDKNEVDALLNEDVVIFSSVLMRRSAIEAAAVGTPSVLTSGVGCAAWMAEAGAGRVVPAAEPTRLAEVIREWLEDGAGLAAAGQKAVTWAETFAVERVAEELRRFHRDVVGAYRGSH